MDDRIIKGHAAALFTIIVWGTTFISTKVLLRSLSPVEILLIRFILGYAALFIACPHMLHTRSWKEEGIFALYDGKELSYYMNHRGLKPHGTTICFFTWDGRYAARLCSDSRIRLIAWNEE